ncbi:hypothetical protein AB1L05_11845 [Cytobacillus horneckiae]|uniref:hypothetical protein n=1 Tax=Cytobacillus horneckiae TaxID=549687 RepID=UPI00203B5608|nr:hypothetical protein [Cytobacillus horneckiae]MCM3178003.1 hypothetical protein [Cytobacillus horneckiae]
MKSNNATYFLYFIWFGGLLVLLTVGYYIDLEVKQYAQDTFQILPLFWSNAIISFMFGLYFALLFTRKWKFHFKPALFFCISLPTLILNFSYPIITTILHLGQSGQTSVSNNLPLWIWEITSFDFIGIVAGSTMVLSILEYNKNKKETAH